MRLVEKQREFALHLGIALFTAAPSDSGFLDKPHTHLLYYIPRRIAMDRFKHVAVDILAIFAPALTVLASQLQQDGFGGVAWSSVVAASIGGALAWSRTSDGGLR